MAEHSFWTSGRSRLAKLPAVARSARTILAVASSLRADPITLRAAALTYLTVLSIVPLLTVIFSVFQAIVGQHELESRLRDFVVQNLAVGAQASVSRFISMYVQRASSVGGVGFIFLLVSAVSLMANIEAAFNHIFRAARSRPILLRFGIYWCLLTVGPVLLALSVAATAVIQGAHVPAWLSPLREYFFIGPLVITYVAFTLMYMIVPNVRVKRAPALIGALVAGTTWEVAKVGYAHLSAGTARNAIYGSLAALPVFLVWVYVSWILVLFGARVAYAAQTAGAPGIIAPVRTPLERELLVAHVMRFIALAFSRGAPAPDAEELARKLGAFGPDVDDSLARLREAKLARNVDEGGWVPARALDRITLADVRDAARREGGSEIVPAAEVDLAQRWERADSAADRELSISLEDLVRDSTLPG